MSTQIRRRPARRVLAAWGLLTLPALAASQAPATSEQPWPIPQNAIERATLLGSHATSAPTARPYDLAQLIDLAERTSPETRAAWEEARAAAAAIGLAEAAYLPQLSFQAIGGFQHTPLPVPKDLVPKGYFISDTREVLPSLALKWLLFDFGRRDAALEAAKADSFVANVTFTGAHQSLIFSVSQAYFDLSAARGRLRAAQQALAAARTTEDAAVAKRNTGLGTIVSVAQAQRQSAQMRYAVAAAEAAQRTARANLIASLGVAADTQLEVTDASELPLPRTPEQSVTAAIHLALAQRPDIIAALGKMDAAQASLKSEERSYYPIFELSGSAFQNFGSVSSDGKPFSTIDKPGGALLFSFSVPIYDGGTRRSRVSVARSKLHVAEEQLVKTQDSASQQVVKAYNALVSYLAEYDAATAYRDAAHTAYDAALRSYRQGVGTYIDLATEENAVVQAETQVEDARASAHTAAAALAFAMGGAATAPSAENP
ncbi:MAG TPA: TolC family protein [Steroidobacteraceae bacterium]